MAAESLNQLLLLYSGFALAALLFFLVFIARFYEQFSGERTGYRLFMFTLACYAIGWIRYASIDQSSGDAAGDLALGLGGILLLLHVLLLNRLMTRTHPVRTPESPDTQDAPMPDRSAHDSDGLPLAFAWSSALSLFASLGDIGLIAALVVMGRLSGRLGSASGVERHHRLFYLAGALIGLRLVCFHALPTLIPSAVPIAATLDAGWVLIIDGLPALGITLGVVAAWRYWSWLLAERS